MVGSAVAKPTIDPGAFDAIVRRSPHVLDVFHVCLARDVPRVRSGGAIELAYLLTGGSEVALRTEGGPRDASGFFGTGDFSGALLIGDDGVEQTKVWGVALSGERVAGPGPVAAALAGGDVLEAGLYVLQWKPTEGFDLSAEVALRDEDGFGWDHGLVRAQVVVGRGHDSLHRLSGGVSHYDVPSAGGRGGARVRLAVFWLSREAQALGLFGGVGRNYYEDLIAFPLPDVTTFFVGAHLGAW